METLQKIALVVTIIGAINWLLIGIMDFNFVEALFDVDSMIARIIYIVIGVAGLINLGILFNHIKPE